MKNIKYPDFTAKISFLFSIILICSMIFAADVYAADDIKIGQTLTFTMYYTNNTTANQANVQITDKVPQYTEFVNMTGYKGGGATHNTDGSLVWTVSTLTPGETMTVSFSVRVTDEANAGDVIKNKASYIVNGKTIPSNETENPVNYVKKSEVVNGTNGNVVKIGQNIKYTLSFANTTGAALSNVVVTDSVPEGTAFVEMTGYNNSNNVHDNNGSLTWTIASMNIDEKLSVTFTVKVTSELTAGDIIRNTANFIVNGKTTPSNEVQNPVNYAKHSSVTDNDANDPEVKIGQVIVYTIEYVNTTAQNQTDIKITDSVPAGTAFVSMTGNAGVHNTDGTLEWTISSLAPQAKATVTFSVRVTSALRAGDIIRNKAKFTVNGKTEESNEVENPVNYSKHSQVVNGTNGNIVKIGQNILYTISYVNKTGAALSNVVVTDSVPQGTAFVNMTGYNGSTNHEENGALSWTISSLRIDEVLTVTFTVKVTSQLTAGDIVKNTASFTVNGKTKPSNEVQNPVNYAKHSSVTGNDDGDPDVKIGQIIVYTIAYVNTTGQNQTDIKISDSVPAGTAFVEMTGYKGSSNVHNNNGTLEWKIQTLAPKEVATVTFSVSATSVLHAGDIVRNKASFTVDGKTEESNEVKNPVNYTKHSEVIGNDTTGRVIKIDQQILYTISYVNTTGKALTDVVVTDSIPTDTAFVSNTVYGNGTFERNGADIKWNIPSLAVNEVLTVTFTVRATREFESGDVILNKAKFTIDGKDHDSNEVNNPVNFAKHSTVDGNEYGDDVAMIGDNIIYRISYVNIETVTLYDVTIRDTVPYGTEFVEMTAYHDGAMTHTGTDLEWKCASLAPQEVMTVTFTVKVTYLLKAGDIVRNTATFIANGVTKESNEVRNPINYTKHAAVEGINVPMTPVKVGQDLVYTLSYVNTTGENQTDIVVTDSVPWGTEYISMTTYANGEFVKDGDNLSWTIPALAPKEVLTVTFTVRVTRNLHVGDLIVNTGTFNVNGVSKNSNQVTNPVNYEKTVDKDEALTNEILTYRLYYKNYSGSAQKVVILDETPAETVFYAINGSENGTMAAPEEGKTGVVSWTFAAVQPGESVMGMFQVKIVTPLLQKSAINNTGSFIINDGNAIVSNQVHTGVNLVVVGKASDYDKRFVKTGDVIKFTLTAVNSSEHDLTNMSIRDYIPEHTTFVQGSDTMTRVDGSDGTGDEISYGLDSDGKTKFIDINLGTMLIGDKAVIEFEVSVDEITELSIVIPNTAFYSSGGGTPISTSDPDPLCVTTKVESYSLSKEKYVRNEKGDSIECETLIDENHDKIVYVIRVTLPEEVQTSTIISIKDILPEYVEYVPGTAYYELANGVKASVDDSGAYRTQINDVGATEPYMFFDGIRVYSGDNYFYFTGKMKFLNRMIYHSTIYNTAEILQGDTYEDQEYYGPTNRIEFFLDRIIETPSGSPNTGYPPYWSGTNSENNNETVE